MNVNDLNDVEPSDDNDRGRAPHRKSAGPGRERKQKARRASRRKQAGGVVAGMHRRGSKQRSKS